MMDCFSCMRTRSYKTHDTKQQRKNGIPRGHIAIVMRLIRSFCFFFFCLLNWKKKENESIFSVRVSVFFLLLISLGWFHRVIFSFSLSFVLCFNIVSHHFISYFFIAHCCWRRLIFASTIWKNFARLHTNTWTLSTDTLYFVNIS